MVRASQSEPFSHLPFPLPGHNDSNLLFLGPLHPLLSQFQLAYTFFNPIRTSAMDMGMNMRNMVQRSMKQEKRVISLQKIVSLAILFRIYGRTRLVKLIMMTSKRKTREMRRRASHRRNLPVKQESSKKHQTHPRMKVPRIMHMKLTAAKMLKAYSSKARHLVVVTPESTYQILRVATRSGLIVIMVLGKV